MFCSALEGARAGLVLASGGRRFIGLYCFILMRGVRVRSNKYACK